MAVPVSATPVAVVTLPVPVNSAVETVIVVPVPAVPVIPVALVTVPVIWMVDAVLLPVLVAVEGDVIVSVPVA